MAVPELRCLLCDRITADWTNSGRPTEKCGQCDRLVIVEQQVTTEGNVIEPDGEVSQRLRELESEDWQVRGRAVIALGSMGAAAVEAVPTLLVLLKSDQSQIVREKVITALNQVGGLSDAAVPVLTTALDDTSGYVRREAISMLGTIGPSAVSATLKLVGHWKMGELYVSEDAAQALCRIGPAAATAVPELVPQLVAALRVPQRDDDDFLPSRAARILGAVGGVSVVPELVAAMKREDGRLADAAADALSRMGPPAIPSLVAALHDEQYHVRRLAVVSLAKLGPAAAEAVPALLTWGTRPGMGGPKLVGSTLAKIGLVAVRPVMDALPGGLSASDSRDALLETVIQMGRAAAEAVPILASVVIDRVASECVRRDVAKTLGQLGVVAADAVPALATVLRDMVDDDQAPREAAAKALAEIGGSAAVSALATALGRRHRNENIRNLSALALAKLGPAATAAVPDLASAYKDSSDRIVQKHILEALSRIGAAAVPAILDLSEVKSPIKRHEFAASLTRIGPQAIPAVRHAIGDSRPLVRAVAAEALAELEPRGFPEMVSPAVGLEQVKPEEMVEVREALHVFVQVGEWCEQHAPDTWQFSCIKLFNEGAVKGVKGQIISDSKIRRKLEEASKFFRWYFAEFEKIKDLVEDTAEGTNGNALEGRKIMLRWPEGRKGLYLQIYAHGQRAFTLARDYLRKRPLDNKSPKG